MDAIGKVNVAAIPPGDPAIERIELDRVDRLEAVARATRGAPYTQELPGILSWGVEVYALADRGFVLVREGRGIWALAATDAEAATALLWHGLARIGEASWPPVRWITAEQQWAVQVVLAAGLRLAPFGALCVRGRPGTLCPYLPSGPYG
jgi:hypothetical protein